MHESRSGTNSLRRDPSRGAVKAQLPYRYTHAVDAEVAESEDATAVRDDDNPYVPLGPVVHHRGHVPAILGREVHAPRPPVQDRELRARLPDRGGVYDRGHLVHVIDEYSVVQRLVRVVYVLEYDVLPYHVRLGAYLEEGALLLHLEIQAAGGEEAAESQTVALAPLEGAGLVEEGIVQDFWRTRGARVCAGLYSENETRRCVGRTRGIF